MYPGAILILGSIVFGIIYLLVSRARKDPDRSDTANIITILICVGVIALAGYIYWLLAIALPD